MRSYVVALSGRNRGLVGEINGDFAERRRTLGNDGRIAVTFKERSYPHDFLTMRIKQLREVTPAEAVLLGASP